MINLPTPHPFAWLIGPDVYGDSGLPWFMTAPVWVADVGGKKQPIRFRVTRRGMIRFWAGPLL
jgi:hypothetical protein